MWGWEDDICWCGNSDECTFTDCFRHMNNRKIKEGIFTMGLLKGTTSCPLFDNKMKIPEAIALLEQLKAEIEWEHSLEYQLALDVAIEELKKNRWRTE